MAATNIKLTSTISSIPTAVAVVASISIAVSYSQPTIGLSDVGSSILVDTEIIQTTPLTNAPVTIIDAPVLNIGKNPSDSLTASESIDKFDIEIAKSDSVTAVESRVKVFTDFIDFDPSDDDVDATPVTISEAAAFDLSKNFSGADDVTPSESIVKAPNKSPSDSIAASDQLNSFHFGKTFSDTATSSEEINRIDVTTVLTDDVTITESTAKEITPAGKTDSVSAVQSNVKAFTSNIDFDLSDADVDPDPVTASEQINTFGVTKSLTDTASIVEATAKTVTNNSLADTASPTESTAFDVTVPGFTDSLTAVEGIKLEPDISVSNTVSATESAVFNSQLVFSHTASVTESINTTLTLGESSYLYPDFVVASDGAETGKVQGYHIGTNRIRVTTSPEYSYQLNDEFGMLNESRIFGESLDAIQRYNVIFIQDRFRFRTVDIDGVIGHNDSLLNTAPLAAAANDSIARRSFTGVLGAAELLNEGIVNSDTITYTDTTNAGLLVNFIYTDTDDPELGGHFLNETPLCAGAII
jgi:hypothetical protein